MKPFVSIIQITETDKTLTKTAVFSTSTSFLTNLFQQDLT